MVKSKTNGLYFYHYLHIMGGSGDTGRGEYRNGGEFDYIAFYCMEDDLLSCNMCYRIWCEEKGIPYGEGKDIQEAYNQLLEKLEQTPLTCG